MKTVYIPFQKGDIPAVMCYPETPASSYPAVLIMHGFVGCKEGDKGKFEKMSEALLKAGFATLRIDFCSCGESTVSKQFYDINRLQEEALCAFAYLRKQSNIDSERCGMIGHSLGGRIAELISVSDDIAAIVTLNGAMGNKYRCPWWLKEDLYRMQEDCKFHGVTSFVDSNGATLQLYQNFFVALEQSDTDRAIQQYQKPLLVVYGDEDPTVDPRVSKDLFAMLDNPRAKLVAIEGANHTFNAKTGDFTKLYECIEVVKNWLCEVL